MTRTTGTDPWDGAEGFWVSVDRGNQENQGKPGQCEGRFARRRNGANSVRFTATLLSVFILLYSRTPFSGHRFCQSTFSLVFPPKKKMRKSVSMKLELLRRCLCIVNSFV